MSPTPLYHSSKGKKKSADTSYLDRMKTGIVLALWRPWQPLSKLAWSEEWWFETRPSFLTVFLLVCVDMN